MLFIATNSLTKNVYRWWRKAAGRAAMIAALAALLVLLGNGAARAVTITVDSLADDTAAGHCDLREAINSSNMLGFPTGTCAAGSGTDTVQFSVTGTITLTSSLPIIISKLTINGPVAATPQITIDGANSSSWTRRRGSSSGGRITLVQVRHLEPRITARRCPRAWPSAFRARSSASPATPVQPNCWGAGGQCSITVQFDPDGFGLARGKLQVTNTTTGGSAHADLIGFAF